MTFRFKDKTRAELIRNYVDTLCKELPEVATELLNVPIKNVEYWLMGESDNEVPAPADSSELTGLEIGLLPCGCLIGGSLIAAARLYPDVIDLLNEKFTTAVELTTDALKTLDGEFDGIDRSIVDRIGMSVSDEIHGRFLFGKGINRVREKEFEKYIKDRIRKNLSISEN